jgi:type IV pilus assembly protein PilZ
MTDNSDLPELKVKLTTKDELYMASMPFVRDGGIFVSTRTDFDLGQHVHLELELIDEKVPLSVEGKIVWKTPAGAQGNMLPGVGVQFMSKEGHKIHKTIEHYLAGMDESGNPTDTM